MISVFFIKSRKQAVTKESFDKERFTNHSYLKSIILSLVVLVLYLMNKGRLMRIANSYFLWEYLQNILNIDSGVASRKKEIYFKENRTK